MDFNTVAKPTWAMGNLHRWSGSWGEPAEINRTTSAGGEREQWVYRSGSYLYFENDHLSAIQN